MRCRIFLSTAAVVLVSGAVQAAPEPQAFDFGSGKLIPMLEVIQKRDDNIFSQANGEESDSITQVKPVVQFLSRKNASSVALTYTGDYGKYWAVIWNSPDNYADHTLSFDALLSSSDMLSIDFGASLGRLHDNRGEGSSEGLNAAQRKEPDEYDLNNVNLLLDFGRDTARLGIELEAGRSAIDYSNNRTETRFRDRDETLLGARLYARGTGKTKFFLGVSTEEFEYSTSPLFGSSIDNDQDAWFVGAEWEATGKTTGAIKFGSMDKDFSAAARGDDDVTVWDIDVTFSPRTYSHILFSASNDARETNGTGAFIEARDLTLSWLHQWSDRCSSTVSYGTGDDDYASDTRQDDRDSFAISVAYDWQRWITIGAGISRSERDSNQNSFDFEKNVIQVSLDMTL